MGPESRSLSDRVPHLADRLQGFGTTVFAEMTRLAQEHDAVNLGQGFPDFDGPDFVKRAAAEAIESGHNQYARTAGIPSLTRAIAAQRLRHTGVEYDPDDEVTVFSGATEAIASAMQALLGPGDEVVMFEPFYDSYRASVAMAGGTSRVVTLRAPDFRFDEAALHAAVTERTRLLLLNTPHNPTGRVFDARELELIAGLCRERDLVLLSDEVYEHIVHEGRHVSPSTLADMRDRTVVISSAGKTFSLTGWKVGWTCAAAGLTRALRTAHQFVTFCTATPLQHAVAAALDADDEYFAQLRASYTRRRDRLCGGLAEIGFGVHRPQGTYFVLADIRPLGFEDDVAFCLSLPERAGVVAVPPTAFYVNRREGRHLARFAFCKSDGVLDEALRRLRRLAA